MTETLTIRISVAQRKALRARSVATGKTESQLVRELIAGQLEAKGTLGERAGKHFGKLNFEPTAGDGDPWRAQLHRMNTRS